MKEIKLSKGYVALVDDEDFERVNQHKWQAHIDRKEETIYNVYATCNMWFDGKRKTRTRMHRFIIGVTDSKIKVDHKDHNGLNNQKYNLRKATNQQNQANSRLPRTNTSGFKGVNRVGRLNKWQVNIQEHGQQKYIGLFRDKVKAAKAYDKEAIRIFGEFANLNFPRPA